jgi:hypothetical protein
MSAIQAISRLQEDFMEPIRVALLLALISAIPAPAAAADLPSRKPGLWQITMNIEGRAASPQVILQCIDPTTDQMMQSNSGPYSATVCPKREVHQSADSITIDSVCTIGGKPATAHATITGSFDSTYTMTVTSQSEAIPASNMTMTIGGKWLGPCTADQKPGDIIFSNGRKLNILQAQQGAPSPGPPFPSR